MNIGCTRGDIFRYREIIGACKLRLNTRAREGRRRARLASAYLARSATAFSAPSFVLVARALRRRLAHRVCHPTLFAPRSAHSTAAPSFRLFLSFLLFSRIRTHTGARVHSPSLSLSLFPSFSHSRSRCVEKRSMRTPRYYVMPADRGADILCMLMPHNVGFVPLFSVYLLDSPPGPIAFVANGVCVPRAAFSLPPPISRSRPICGGRTSESDDVSSRRTRPRSGGIARERKPPPRKELRPFFH